MRDVVGATAKAALVPGVVEVEGERCVDANRRVQALGWLPGAVTHSGNGFAIGAGGVQRDAAAIHAERETVADQAADLDLEAFERAIDVTDGRAATGFFAEHVPGLEGGAEFNLNIALDEFTDARKAELKVR